MKIFTPLNTTIFIVLVGFILFVPFVFAHGVGESYELKVNNYFIDIGYNTFDPQAGRPIRFEFLLSDFETKSAVLFSDVLVRIERADRVIFAGRVHRPDIGPTVLTQTFPSEGDYKVIAKFNEGGEKLVETSFDIAVVPGNEEGGFSFSPFLLIALLVGLGLGFFAGTRK